MVYMLLSYPIDLKTPLYGKTPPPSISQFTSISNGDSSNTALFSIHNHTGTHIDAPKHFVDSGKSISSFALDDLIFTRSCIVDCPKDQADLIVVKDLQHASDQLQEADCLLLRTGYEIFRFDDIYRTHNPGIAKETILWLRKNYPNIRCIGIDSISISSFQHRQIGRESHVAAFTESEEFGEPLLLIEDMKLACLPEGRFISLFIFPWQVEGIDSAPCSILAEIS